MKPIPAVIVEEGDSLTRIAARELGNVRAWAILAQLNKLRDPNLIHPGQLLIMPRAWQP